MNTCAKILLGLFLAFFLAGAIIVILWFVMWNKAVDELEDADNWTVTTSGSMTGTSDTSDTCKVVSIWNETESTSLIMHGKSTCKKDQELKVGETCNITCDEGYTLFEPTQAKGVGRGIPEPDREVMMDQTTIDSTCETNLPLKPVLKPWINYCTPKMCKINVPTGATLDACAGVYGALHLQKYWGAEDADADYAMPGGGKSSCAITCPPGSQPQGEFKCEFGVLKEEAKCVKDKLRSLRGQ